MTNPAEWIDLTGKTAHVTGAGRGIGAAIASALAMAGATVMASDMDLPSAQATAQAIGGHAMQLDVSDRWAVDAATVMIAAGNGGRIINLSSTQAMTPGVGVSYDGSKAAVQQITKALALELAPHNINVNALSPGPTWVQGGEPLTDTVSNRIARLPKGHWGDPMEQGKAALFLASEMSSFVTGIYLPVDGGWLVL